MAKEVFEVGLDGGPCGGKTTAGSVAMERFSEHGIRVLVVPEAATLLISSGLHDFGTLVQNREWMMKFEKQLLALQGNLLAHFRALAAAAPEDKVLILIDRPRRGVSAYVNADDFATLLNELGISASTIADEHDAICILRTAALGAEAFYTTSNNAARQETDLAFARELDEKTLNAYVGHHRMQVFDNSTDFQTKVASVMAYLSNVVGVPVPTMVERTYHLRTAPDLTAPYLADARRIEIEQTYLAAPRGVEIRVRKRMLANGAASYFLTEKRDVSGVSYMFRSHQISADQYRELLATRDPARTTIRKTRYCFVSDNQYFQLDHLHEPANAWLLQVELTTAQTRVRLPRALSGARDVTRDARFRTANIARAGFPSRHVPSL